VATEIIDVQITGTINLQKALDEFSGSIQRRIIRPALQDVGAYFVSEIRQNCNFTHGYSTGALADSIIAITTISNSTGKQRGQVKIGPTYQAVPHGNSSTTRPGIYALWVEYGLKNPRVGGLRSGKKDKNTGNVPNYPAQPFMRPAFDNGATKSIEIFRDRVMQEIARRTKP
jgi:HK97 gp10 family phage protein